MHFRRILALVLLFSLYSCGPQWHIEKADKHKNKALEKGAIFKTDTIHGDRDTIVNTYWKDSILVVDRTITDTIYIQGEVLYITKKDKRIARRKEKRNDKYKYKLKKKELIVEKKKIKAWNKFWLGFVIGSIITFILMILIRKYFSKLKNLLS